MEVKVCSVCKQEKDISCFALRSGGRYYACCRDCKKEKERVYRENNREKLRIISREWRKNHPESIKRTYEKRKSKIIPNICKWQKDNPKKRRAAVNKWKRNKIVTSSRFRIETKIRAELRDIVSRLYSVSDETCINRIGCSINVFVKHIESQFTEGMTWENHGSGEGKWNLNHIIPISYFNLLDSHERKLCSHYLNVQPLWEEDNIKKGMSIPDNCNELILKIEESLSV